MARTRKGYNPKSLANLKPQKAGEPSHNPNGKPSKINNLLDCINTELEKLSENGISTNMQIIAAILVAKATQGNDRAIETILEYKHAKPSQGVDLNIEKPLSIIFQSVGGRDDATK